MSVSVPERVAAPGWGGPLEVSVVGYQGTQMMFSHLFFLCMLLVQIMYMYMYLVVQALVSACVCS